MTNNIKYTRNSNFFNKITIKNCAYAGFIAADGCIYEYNDNNKRLKIELSLKDIEYLESFKKDIEYSGPILRYKYPYTYKNNTIYYHKCHLHISDINIVNDLAKNFGIFKKKSFNIKPPNLTGNYKLAFIIGLLDGDGCIRISKTHGFEIHYCSASFSLIKWVVDALNLLVPNFVKIKQPATIFKDINRKNVLYTFAIRGKRAKQIYNKLKKIKCNKMKRKWQWQ